MRMRRCAGAGFAGAPFLCVGEKRLLQHPVLGAAQILRRQCAVNQDEVFFGGGKKIASHARLAGKRFKGRPARIRRKAG